jgi:KDO2-lipid IV(A) lauroyltransferase
MTATLRHRLEYGAVRVFAALVSAVPEGAAYFLARRMGDLLHAVDARHRRTGRANLRDHYTDTHGTALTEAEVRRITRDVFRHLVSIGVEMVRLRRTVERRGISAVVDLQQTEHLRAAMERGKGAIVVSGHLGNWEIMAAAGMGLGVYPVSVYRPFDNPLIDAWVRSLRGMEGADVVEKQGAVRGLLRALRKGRLVALLVDQNAGRHGVFAPFFGSPVSTVPTPAELALRTGAAIIPGFALRVGPGFRYRTWFEPPLEVRHDAEDKDAEVRRITAELNARLEAAIRQAPEQWLWLHRRWKTRPPARAGGE